MRFLLGVIPLMVFPAVLSVALAQVEYPPQAATMESETAYKLQQTQPERCVQYRGLGADLLVSMAKLEDMVGVGGRPEATGGQKLSSTRAKRLIEALLPAEAGAACVSIHPRLAPEADWVFVELMQKGVASIKPWGQDRFSAEAIIHFKMNSAGKPGVHPQGFVYVRVPERDKAILLFPW